MEKKTPETILDESGWAHYKLGEKSFKQSALDAMQTFAAQEVKQFQERIDELEGALKKTLQMHNKVVEWANELEEVLSIASLCISEDDYPIAAERINDTLNRDR